MDRKPLDPNLAAILDSIRDSVQSPASPDAPLDTSAPARTETADASDSLPRPAGGRKTVEEFLAELLQPQVKAWLDANLPEIVQKMVAEEVQRLVGRS